eukprot:3466560-Pleurochrysis_carterae.AAC.2
MMLPFCVYDLTRSGRGGTGDEHQNGRHPLRVVVQQLSGLRRCSRAGEATAGGGGDATGWLSRAAARHA